MKNAKILVVDDDPKITMALKGYFSAKGYEMFTALNGQEAIEAIEDKPMDLVLLDMKMPGIDGVGVLKEIRQRWHPVRVIVITGHAEEYLDPIREAGGVEGFLVKPVALKELTDKVEKVLAASPKTLLVFQEIERLRQVYVAPPLEPSKEKIKAKLLFVEPVISVYEALSLYFIQRSEFNEDYELKSAHTSRKALLELVSFQPDIVLLDFQSLYNCYELAAEILNSSSKPKEVIIFGVDLSRETKAKIEGKGAKSVDVFYSRPDQVNRLIQQVREIALKYGLIAGR